LLLTKKYLTKKRIKQAEESTSTRITPSSS
jgi:hypothetical protein